MHRSTSVYRTIFGGNSPYAKHTYAHTDPERTHKFTVATFNRTAIIILKQYNTVKPRTVERIYILDLFVIADIQIRTSSTYRFKTQYFHTILCTLENRVCYFKR